MSSTKKDTKPTPTATDTPQPLTRSLFVSPDYEKIAISKSTMFVLTKDGQGVEEVPMLASVRETGSVPEGFCVDMNVDPDTVVATLAKKGITNTSQLEPGMLEKIKETLNEPDNLRIVPKGIYDEKRAITLAALAENKGKVDENKEGEEEEEEA